MTPRVVAALRLAVSALGVVALVARFQWGLGSATFEPANFFAYVTVQSNIAFVIVTAIAAVAALRDRFDSERLAAVRAIALTCIITSGLVFALLVVQSAQRGIRVDVPWSDVILHFVLPVIALADWAVLPRASARFRIIAFVVGYALVWGGLTILRGLVVEWYPYYFLDPRQLESGFEFATSAAIAIGAFVLVGAGVVALPHRKPEG